MEQWQILTEISHYKFQKEMCWLSLLLDTPHKKIKVNENQFSYNIQMSEDTQTLDEVVVVGFGTQRKANLTEAVAT